MAIPITFLTAVLKKPAIQASYPGGLVRFLQDHPEVSQDEHLVGVSFMSGGGLQEFIDSLKSIGFDLAQSLAVGEMFNGEWEPCRGIEFRAAYPDGLIRGWQATAVPSLGES